jgi:hypothetical protein
MSVNPSISVSNSPVRDRPLDEVLGDFGGRRPDYEPRNLNSVAGV